MKVKELSFEERKFIDPLSDFGFKRIFGQEENKSLLLSFLNGLLPEKHIVDLQYNQTEFQGLGNHQKSARFDVACTTNDGERFIVEMQRAKQLYFVDRAIWYFSMAFTQQKRGECGSRLIPVYSVNILDFILFDQDSRMLHSAHVRDDEDNRVLSKVENFYFLELPKFTKSSGELESALDEWLYLLKNTFSLNKVPEDLLEKYTDYFSIAERANLTEDEWISYKEAMMDQVDYNNCLECKRQEGLQEGREEGREEGRAEGREEGASMKMIEHLKNMQDAHFSDEQIMLVLNVTAEELLELRKNI